MPPSDRPRHLYSNDADAEVENFIERLEAQILDQHVLPRQFKEFGMCGGRWWCPIPASKSVSRDGGPEILVPSRQQAFRSPSPFISTPVSMHQARRKNGNASASTFRMQKLKLGFESRSGKTGPTTPTDSRYRPERLHRQSPPRQNLFVVILDGHGPPMLAPDSTPGTWCGLNEP